MAIHNAPISLAPLGLPAAFALWASLRLFNALCAFVPRFARKYSATCSVFPWQAPMGQQDQIGRQSLLRHAQSEIDE